MGEFQRFALRAESNAALFGAEPVQWAMGRLVGALEAHGLARADGHVDLTIDVLDANGTEARRLTDAAGLDRPQAAESFALLRVADRIAAIAADARGLVYALTELADRVQHAEGPLFADGFPLFEAPASRVRSMCRAFTSEVEDKPWLHDRSQWIAYLDMLVANRFNRFSLSLGMGYDYPYHNQIISDVYLHFPYPYLLSVPGYDVRIAELPDAERDANLEVLRFIAREAARRGLDFQLALWTQRYDFDDVPNANYTVLGVTDGN